MAELCPVCSAYIPVLLVGESVAGVSQCLLTSVHWDCITLLACWRKHSSDTGRQCLPSAGKTPGIAGVVVHFSQLVCADCGLWVVLCDSITVYNGWHAMSDSDVTQSFYFELLPLFTDYLAATMAMFRLKKNETKHWQGWILSLCQVLVIIC